MGVWISEEYVPDRYEHAPELEIPEFARAEINATLVDSKQVCMMALHITLLVSRNMAHKRT